jgi:hypothetical protein
MKRLTLVLFLAATACVLAGTATQPANLSPAGVANWAIIGGHVGSGTGALPAVPADGARYTDLSTPTQPIEYRSNGSSWIAITSGGSSSADLAAHMADSVDPHGASETITAGLTLGSGTADTSISRTATGTLTIASYVALIPMTAEPDATAASGTLWLDATGTLWLRYNGIWNEVGGVAP